MALIISADEIKKTLLNYSPEHAEEFHRESARLADQQFYTSLKACPYNRVILLSGGTASGKTEFLSTQLIDKDDIILDATLATEEGAKIKIKSILAARKTPIVYSVIPDNLKRAFNAFLSRDRKFSDEHFYATHSGARKTLLWIASNYPDIDMHIIESSYTGDQKLQFAELKFDDNDQLVTYLIDIQLTESDILKSLNFINE